MQCANVHTAVTYILSMANALDYSYCVRQHGEDELILSYLEHYPVEGHTSLRDKVAGRDWSTFEVASGDVVLGHILVTWENGTTSTVDAFIV